MRARFCSGCSAPAQEGYVRPEGGDADGTASSDESEGGGEAAQA
eukprot:SAG11_NODE_7013_length_1208_cov_1.520289_1_plen_43_part_10